MSCPCQPFSGAGKGKGTGDERHLWPVAFNLIRECEPDVVIGEQVENAIAHGWLDGIRADLEGEDYPCGDVTLGAHSLLAPHIRARLYWLALRNSKRLERRTASAESGGLPNAQGGSALGGLAYTAGSTGPQYEREPGSGTRRPAGEANSAICGNDHGRLADSLRPGLEGHGRHGDHGHESRWNGTEPVGSTAAGGAACGRMGDAESDDKQRNGLTGESCGRTEPAGRSSAWGGRMGKPDGDGREPWQPTAEATGHGRPIEPASLDHWSDSIWIPCRDGKHRRIPTEPALFPLADGLPYKLARRGSVRPALLKGAGNAIVPQVAAAFIRAFLTA